MDFFEHQEQARRATSWLLLLFALAVAALIAGLYLVVAGLVGYARYTGNPLAAQPLDLWVRWDPTVLGWVALGTGTVIFLGTLYKISQLKAGGPAVAESVGGRPVESATTDPEERQLVNVVEEMALASGIPPPPVYLLDREPGINAFAAGYTPDDAAIGLTRGALAYLSRQELQGVIAHEFSHILNGDMRLSTRLIGLIHGILVISLAGRQMLYRSRWHSGFRRSGGGRLAVLGVGGGLLLIGALGVFFGNLIKAAVSRQREYLADAAAVQFTRFPSGLTGALKKIGGLEDGSVVLDPRGATVSHMFFSQGLIGAFDRLFATHPPLDARIRRFEPHFHGSFPVVRRRPLAEPQATAPATAPVAAAGPTAGGPTAAVGDEMVPVELETTGKATKPLRAPALLDQIGRIGNPSPAHLTYVHALLDDLPSGLREAAHDPFGGRAVIFALLLSQDPVLRTRQLGRLAEHAESAVAEETRKLEPLVAKMAAAARLPLLDLVIPTLGKLSPRQYRVFTANLDHLIHADDQVSVLEWMLRHVLLRHLEPRFRTLRKRTVQYYALTPFTSRCAGLLSTLAYRAHQSDADAQAAFEAGRQGLGLPGLALLPRARCGLPVLDHALEALAEVSPREKRRVLQACAACIMADRQVTVDEAELLRAIADALGCPMPPLLPGQPMT